MQDRPTAGTMCAQHSVTDDPARSTYAVRTEERTPGSEASRNALNAPSGTLKEAHSAPP